MIFLDRGEEKIGVERERDHRVVVRFVEVLQTETGVINNADDHPIAGFPFSEVVFAIRVWSPFPSRSIREFDETKSCSKLGAVGDRGDFSPRSFLAGKRSCNEEKRE